MLFTPLFIAMASVAFAGAHRNKNCPSVQGTCSLLDGYKVTSFNGHQESMTWTYFTDTHPLFDAGDMAVFVTREKGIFSPYIITSLELHCGNYTQKFPAADVVKDVRIHCHQGSCATADCHIDFTQNTQNTRYSIDVTEIVYGGSQGIGGECYRNVDNANCPEDVEWISDDTDGLQSIVFAQDPPSTTGAAEYNYMAQVGADAYPPAPSRSDSPSTSPETTSKQTSPTVSDYINSSPVASGYAAGPTIGYPR